MELAKKIPQGIFPFWLMLRDLVEKKHILELLGHDQNLLREIFKLINNAFLANY